MVPITGEHPDNPRTRNWANRGSAYIDKAADAYSDLIQNIVKAAEMETTLKKLLAESNQRRVNALEFRFRDEEAQTFTNSGSRRWKGKKPSGSSASGR